MMDTRTTTERTERTETDKPQAPSIVAVILAASVGLYLVGSLVMPVSVEVVAQFEQLMAMIVGALATYMANKFGPR